MPAAALAAAALQSHLPLASAHDRQVGSHEIIIEKFRFVPVDQPILPGDTITWVNRDIVPHTATALDESWDTGEIAPGQQKVVTVTAGFSQDYFCRFHPMMKARLDITGDDESG